MALLRLSICKTEKEWAAIEKVIQTKNNGKQVSHRGKGFNQYITSEINKKFSKRSPGKCDGVKVAHTRKSFDIRLEEDVFEEVKCQASELGIDPAILITRMIIDPHFLDKKTIIDLAKSISD